MKRIPYFFFFFLLSSSIFSQSDQYWSAQPGGSGYDDLTSMIGLSPQSPCTHGNKKAHLDQVFDNFLNKEVFRFKSHTVDDNNTSSGCNGNSNDPRSRNEIRYDNNPIPSQKVQYKWKMKLPADFKVSTGFAFTHLHQIKFKSGWGNTEPLFVLTASHYDGEDLLAVNYSDDLYPPFPFDNNTFPKVYYEKPLDNFLGKWIEITEVVLFRDGVNEGKYGILITDLTNGEELMKFVDNSISTSKTNATLAQSQAIQTKWGVYRTKNSQNQDEEVLFDQFEVKYFNNTDDIVFQNNGGTRTQEIGTSDDALVRSGSYGNSNYGSANNLHLKNDPVQSSYNRQSYLKYDLSEIPGTVVSAKVKMYVQAVNLTATVNNSWIIKYAADDSWSEGSITFNNRPVTGAVVATIDATDAGTYAEWDVTGITAAEHGGDQMLSLNLTSTSRHHQSNAILSSKEDPIWERRPVLVVEYEPDHTIKTNDDTYVRDGAYGNSNYGASPGLVIKRSNPGNGYSRESYLKFDLWEYDAAVESAYLKVAVRNANTQSHLTTWDLKEVNNDSWSESTMTWNNKPSPGSVIASKQGVRAGSVLFDVTDQVNATFNGDKTLSLHLSSISYGSKTNVDLASKEYTIVDRRPELIIKFADGSNAQRFLDNPTVESNTTLEASEFKDAVLPTFEVFPNPATTELSVRLDNETSGRVILQIYSAEGHLVKTQKTNAHIACMGLAPIDINELLPGIYFIQIVDETKQYKVTKFVKQ